MNKVDRKIQAGNSLAAVLQQEQEVLEAMVDALKEERSYIVHFDGLGLERTLVKKEELGRQLTELEALRQEYDQGMTISQWIAHADDEHLGLILTNAYTRMRGVAREVAALGHANQVIFKQTQAMFRSITGIIQANEKESYGVSGEKADPGLKGVLYNRRL